MMATEVDVTGRFAWKFSLEELEEFVSKAREHGRTSVVWYASEGDQREPSELRLEARSDR